MLILSRNELVDDANVKLYTVEHALEGRMGSLPGRAPAREE